VEGLLEPKPGSNYPFDNRLVSGQQSNALKMEIPDKMFDCGMIP
jgi:hypothetical protein